MIWLLIVLGALLLSIGIAVACVAAGERDARLRLSQGRARHDATHEHADDYGIRDEDFEVLP